MLGPAKLDIKYSGDRQTTISLETTASDPHDAHNGPFVLSLNASRKKVETATINPFKAEVKFLPASLLALVCDPKCTKEYEDGRLIIKGPTCRIEVDAASGRPIMIGIANGDGWITASATSDALAVERREIEQQLKNARTYDAANPWRSAVCLLLDERVAALQRQAASGSDSRLAQRVGAWQALRKLAAAWKPFPEAGNILASPSEFKLPGTDVPDFNALFSSDRAARRPVANLLLGAYRQVVPQDGCLWPLGRDVLLDFVDQLPDEGYEALAQSADVGPVSQYFLIWLGAENAARLGFQQISPEAFRREYRPLLSGDSSLSKLVLALAEAARLLEEDELRALAGFVENEASRMALADALAQLRKEPQRPIAESAAEALDRLWQDWLGPKLRATFIVQLLAEDRARTAAAPDHVRPIPPNALPPLAQPLGRLEEIEQELRDAAAKARSRD